jgi:hypothetical protein
MAGLRGSFVDVTNNSKVAQCQAITETTTTTISKVEDMAEETREEVMVEVVINREVTMIIKEEAMEVDSSNRMAAAIRVDMEVEIKADMEEGSNNMEVEAKEDSSSMEAETKEAAMITNKVVDTAGANNTMVAKDNMVGATSHKAATMVAAEALAEVMI